MRRYGTTFEQLEQLLVEQGGRCAICHKRWQRCKAAKRARDEGLFLHYLCVDHDHDRNVVRGLLCNNCNTAIGLFEEDLDRFESAVTYLRTHRDRPTPLVSPSESSLA
ncbi:MAG: endonuclease VII domain-containing protein [Candidatus Eremiobacteraeota bacterium]|nr:endonuclease VII domain-containing protein [Candidatus Eremiobacteraeota bacterium]